MRTFITKCTTEVRAGRPACTVAATAASTSGGCWAAAGRRRHPFSLGQKRRRPHNALYSETTATRRWYRGAAVRAAALSHHRVLGSQWTRETGVATLLMLCAGINKGTLQPPDGRPTAATTAAASSFSRRRYAPPAPGAVGLQGTCVVIFFLTTNLSSPTFRRELSQFTL